MALSTNSVIHYTKKIENLSSIISDKSFKIKYCNENLDCITKSNSHFAINMVSFCDIPLSDVKNHIDSYGSFGIGLTKSWAKNKGLNPVMYIEENSKLTKNYHKQFDRLLNSNEKEMDIHQDFIDDFFEFCKYLKLYEGPLKTGKVNSDNYRFYDEREWRYCLSGEDLKEEEFSAILLSKEYNKNRDEYNQKLIKFRLEFDFNDISYLIVDDESEIPELIKCIENSFEDDCTAKQLKILSTKILTKNQICNDF
ncbi:abortive infection system antitoxin AbiGi family protein [Tenacibaculum finnmarkense]|uniref:Abortive phage resistance protein AbiGi, antitoxin n=1 Tax=Tenacibaculum finnmarkense genomovar ulcerans TaxID=2781388 RepID=A0A2I2MBD1_9FLAO|nr:abortive infection system antitoxin AbiGi family protein [Tenacibaculum finnmarkense]MBE7698643.1 hypothetical protein [Tenacibaculum finnmarkense genomovar ulcerans]SOU89360.1 conserved hypothetical protein [Tenacibaculum finnmarkense genomovar ulcerans]